MEGGYPGVYPGDFQLDISYFEPDADILIMFE
jgi:hypothetical protein